MNGTIIDCGGRYMASIILGYFPSLSSPYSLDVVRRDFGHLSLGQGLWVLSDARGQRWT